MSGSPRQPTERGRILLQHLEELSWSLAEVLQAMRELDQTVRRDRAEFLSRYEEGRVEGGST